MAVSAAPPRAKAIFTTRRLYRALPSVLLGTLFNILDAVSTGLLIFPSGGAAFSDVQIQGMSMYIMSTILSQIAMTLGGSRFPGALGAMLIEILPLLRGIGSDIEHALGDDSPALIPTVMVAYALTSFLIGIISIALGVFKAGLLVAYFPQTVLTGVIGAVGISLFILGLELPLPVSSPPLTLSSIQPVLFNQEHLPLLFASIIPAFLLSISIRSSILKRCTFGATKHAYYIPIYIILIPIIFWIIVGILGKANAAGMAMLVQKGWLFEIQDPVGRQVRFEHSWNYWSLFDFSRVKRHALTSATTNILLVVGIGLLNVPIYVPALGLSLGLPVHMNHEFIGQGAANILAGLAGTVPNIVQLSYSIHFTRAGGDRFEAGIVTALTIVFFFISSTMLPYVPTILASVLVLFLGIELTIEALWEPAKSTVFSEWLIIMTTLVACTFLGFAPGFGVGMGAAVVVYLLWGIIDTRARLVALDENYSCSGRWSLTDSTRHNRDHSSLRVASEKSCACAAAPEMSTDIEGQDLSRTHWLSQSFSDDTLSRVNVVSLSGYVFFATIPSLEARLSARSQVSTLQQFTIADLTHVHRLETSAVQLLARKARENGRTSTIVLCGVLPESGAHADLRRGGVRLDFGSRCIEGICRETTKKDILAFQDRADAFEWCKFQIESDMQRQSSAQVALKLDILDIRSAGEALTAFSRLPEARGLYQILFPSTLDMNPEAGPDDLVGLIAQFKAKGGRIQRYEPRQVIIKKGDPATPIVFIVQGCVSFENMHSNVSGYQSRLSLSNLLTLYADMASQFFKYRRCPTTTRIDSNPYVSRTLGVGESFGIVDEIRGRDLNAEAWTQCDRVIVSSARPCWTIELHSLDHTASLWPSVKQWMRGVSHGS